MQDEEDYLEGKDQNVITVGFSMMFVGNSFLLHYTLQCVFFQSLKIKLYEFMVWKSSWKFGIG